MRKREITPKKGKGIIDWFLILYYFCIVKFLQMSSEKLKKTEQKIETQMEASPFDFLWNCSLDIG